MTAKNKKKSRQSVKGKTFLSKFFAGLKKRQNFGVLMMILSLAVFFCMSQMEIKGFHWFGLGAGRLELGLNLQEGIIAFIFIIILESKGIYNSDFISRRKISVSSVLVFIINFAVFSSFFSILIDPKESSFLGFLGGIVTTYGFVFGIILGIWFFGTRTIATLAPVAVIVFFIISAWSNLQTVSKATGIWGWLYFVFMVVGFVLQHNFNGSKLTKELKYLFGFARSKSCDIADSIDSVVDKSKKMISENKLQSESIQKEKEKLPAVSPDEDTTIVG